MFKTLLLLAAYLPFQIALNPAQGVDLASIRVMIIGLFLVWLATGLRRKNIDIVQNWQTATLLSFLMLCSVSIFIADETVWSIRKLLFLFSIFPVYFIAANLLDNPQRIVKICKFLVSGGAGVALIGIVQFLAQFIFGLDATYDFWAQNFIAPFLGKSFYQAVLANPSWLVNVGGKTFLRATATFPDPHMLAFYLGLVFPLALGVFLTAVRQRAWWLSSLVLIVTADLLTFSRGGYLGLLAGALVVVIILWKKIGRQHKIAGLTALLLILLAVAVPSPFSARLRSSFNLREGSNLGRLATWQQAVGIIAANPLLGVGIGNYPLEIKATADYREPIYAHNTYLDIAAESGLPSVFLWIGTLLFSMKAMLRRSGEGLIFGMSAVSLVIFAVHSLVETALYSPVVLTTLLIIMSFAGKHHRQQKNG